MAIPSSVIEEIKAKNDIESVISAYVNLKRRGKNLVGLCPFHNEKTPSFTVYPESDSFYCYGCGKGGDAFTFVKLAENLDYIEAVKLLADRSGVYIPEDSGYDDSMLRLKNTIYEINKEAARFYHSYLLSEKGKKVLEYYTGRGLTLNTIKHFGLGAAPEEWDGLLKHLKSKGYTINDMLQAKVIAKSQRGTYYDFFRNRAMFPIINIRGKVIGFSGRALPWDDRAGGKYVNTSDTLVFKKSENLFAMNFAKNHCDEKILLVEGNMDVISLHQAGFENAVAALGTSFTAEQAKLISKYTKEIVLTLDTDEAGQAAVKKAGNILADTGLRVSVLVLPDAKDPDEYIKKFGRDRFDALLNGATSEMEYKLLTAVKDIDVNSDEGRLKYLSRAAAIIAESNDIMTRDLYIGRLSQKYNVSKTAIETRVNELRRQNKRAEQKREINAIINPKFSKSDINPERRSYPAAVPAEEAVIAVLMQHPDLFETAYEKLKPDNMLTSLNRRIYSAISECILSGRDPDISYFGQALSSDELGYLVYLSNSEKCGNNPLIVLKDSIRLILDEATRLRASDTKNMSVDDWAENLRKIIENKQKGN
ncbi:MAG: DNA primase [Clostridia bacterium]|nr:DNA primase [Clostridia bacterium]